MVQTRVNARTIIVDPKAYFLRNLGSVNNTIVHECVHWDQHRKAFELERLYNSSATRIKCQVVGGIKDNTRDATDWMEWQANHLSAAVLMPKCSVDLLARSCKDKLKTPTSRAILIAKMSDCFDVSIQAATNRQIGRASCRERV